MQEVLPTKDSEILENPETTRARGASVALHQLLEAQKLQTTRLRIEPPEAPGSLPKVSFYSDPQTVSKVVELTEADYRALLLFYQERSFYWPDVDDDIFLSNHGKTKRFLLAPLSNFRLLADVNISRKAGTPWSSIALENIQRDKIRPLTETLSLSESNRNLLLNGLKSRAGIILANSVSDPHGISGAAVISALRPDAVLLPRLQNHKGAQEALVLSENHLVIVQLEASDSVELLFRFLSFFEQNQEELLQCAERVLNSFIELRVRRQCGACGKSTALAQSTLQRLPTKIAESIERSYMFSRGCKNCGFSAYRGSVGLESVLWMDEGLKKLVVENKSSEIFILEAYARGTRTVLEDGLSKIYKGLTSFEEVLAVPNSFPAAYELAFNATGSNGGIVAPSKQTPSSEVQKQNHDTGEKQRILVVEDDSDQRQVLQMVFESEGFEVTGAENGKQALEILEGSSFDLVVSDVMMPIMNGIDMVRNLRKAPRLKDIPVLMLTAVSNADDEYTLLSYGADDYCDKNVKKKILLKRVERLLTRKKMDGKNPVQHLLQD